MHGNGPDAFLALANKYGIWLEQGRKRLVEWRDTQARMSRALATVDWSEDTTDYGDVSQAAARRQDARDVMRTWCAALKRELDLDVGEGVRARVNFAATGTPLGTNELAEHEARLAALDRLIGQLLAQAGPLTA